MQKGWPEIGDTQKIKKIFALVSFQGLGGSVDSMLLDSRRELAISVDFCFEDPAAVYDPSAGFALKLSRSCVSIDQ
jgi:hypothetical protein